MQCLMLLFLLLSAKRKQRLIVKSGVSPTRLVTSCTRADILIAYAYFCYQLMLGDYVFIVCVMFSSILFCKLHCTYM